MSDYLARIEEQNRLKKEKERLKKEQEQQKKEAQLQQQKNIFANIKVIEEEAKKKAAQAQNRGAYSKGKDAKKSAPKKPEIFFLKELIKHENLNNSSSIDQANRDKLKLKKTLLPILTFINENNASTKAKLKEDAFLILRKIYDNFSVESKQEFTGCSRNLSSKEIIVGAIKEESLALSKKFESAYEQALTFINSFRNFAMHHKVENSFTNFKCDVNGELFLFFKLQVQKELDRLQQELASEKPEDDSRYKHQISYWEKVLAQTSEDMQEDPGNIPLVYVLASVALFIEAKEMQEVLTLTKLSGFITAWIKPFALRGGFKSISAGVFKEDESLELHRLQIQRREEIQQKAESSHKRLVEEYSNFVGKAERATKAPNTYGFYYYKLLRYYNFIDSYPNIPTFEDEIKTRKAEELSKARIERIENIKKDNNDPTKTRRQVPELETDPIIIKKGLTKVFRRGDTFLREAMAFLEDHNGKWFRQNWRIVGNTVLWYEPDTRIEFDIRRKTRPSLNAASSIYKLRYNAKKDGKIVSLGRSNLQALLVAVLMGNNVNFESLRDTAIASTESPAKETVNNKKYWDNISQKCADWNRHQQAQFALKYFRKFIPRMHMNESVAFHQEFKKALYLLDENPSESKAQIRSLLTLFGSSYPQEVENILSASTLLGICQKCCGAFANLPQTKNSAGNKTHKNLFMWKTHALHPTKNCNPKIVAALGWTDKQQISLFDLLMENVQNKNYMLPRIIEIYKEKHSQGTTFPQVFASLKDSKSKREEQEIRSLLTEELLFQEMAFNYTKKLIDMKNFVKVTSTQQENAKRSPLAFNVSWQLQPKIELDLDEFHKKDVKNAINWIFDPARIINSENKHPLKKEEIPQKCLEYVIKTHLGIDEHPILKTKAPKSVSNGKSNLDSLSIVNIVKRILWLQREMLYFICDIEREMIYQLSLKNALPPMEKENYYNFNTLAEKFRRMDDSKYDIFTFSKLVVIRNMIAHGRLYSPATNSNQKEVYLKDAPQIIDDVLKVIGRKSLKEHYSNVKKGGGSWSK